MFGQSGHLSRLCFLDDHDPDLADHDADPGDHDRPDPRDQNRPIRLLTIGRGSDSRTSTVSSWCLLWHRLLGRPASESGRLRQGTSGYRRGDHCWRRLVLLSLFVLAMLVATGAPVREPCRLGIAPARPMSPSLSLTPRIRVRARQGGPIPRYQMLVRSFA